LTWQWPGIAHVSRLNAQDEAISNDHPPPDRDLLQFTKALPEADFTSDLMVIALPALVMHGSGNQITSSAVAALLSAKRLKKAMLKIYPDYPHGILPADGGVLTPLGPRPPNPRTTQAEQVTYEIS